MWDLQTADVAANRVFRAEFREATRRFIGCSFRNHGIDKKISTAILLIELHHRTRSLRFLEAVILRVFVQLARAGMTSWIPDISVGIMQVRPSRALALDGMTLPVRRRFGISWIEIRDCENGSKIGRKCVDDILDQVLTFLSDCISLNVGIGIVRHSLERYRCYSEGNLRRYTRTMTCVEYAGAEYHHGLIEKEVTVGDSTLLYAAVVTRLVEMIDRSEHW